MKNAIAKWRKCQIVRIRKGWVFTDADLAVALPKAHA